MPRVTLGTFPTPLEHLSGLTRHLGGPQILIKRDDLTGLAFGGNKVRKLEMLLGDALSQGATRVITAGDLQTNHGRLTAAAAAKLGLKCTLVINGTKPVKAQGNLLLDYMFGAEVHYVEPDPSLPAWEALESYMNRLANEYLAAGEKPYVISVGGRSVQGTASYVLCMIELLQQCVQMHVKPDYLVVAVGSGSTMAGLLLGARVLSAGCKVIGMSVSRTADKARTIILEDLNRSAPALGYEVQFAPEDICVLDDYIGPGYAIPSDETLEAMLLLARTEGIVLDHVYTAKAMAGLIDLVKKGYFKHDDTVVFFHTGGGPAVFALDEEYRQKLGAF